MQKYEVILTSLRIAATMIVVVQMFAPYRGSNKFYQGTFAILTIFVVTAAIWLD